MAYSSPFILVLQLAIIISVKSQGICYEQEECVGATISSGMVDNIENYCCNYVMSGELRGYSYRSGGECMECPRVFGFFNRSFIGEERSSSYTLQLGFLSGRPLNFAGVNITIITGTGQNSATMVNDFTVTGAAGGSGLFLVSGGTSTSVSVQHTIDGISQERDETYSISVSNERNLENYRFEGIDVTIVDADTVRFFFSEADHSKNEDSDLVIAAQLSKNSDTRLANDVTFIIYPVTIQEASRRGIYIPSAANLTPDPRSPYEAVEADFDTTSFEVIFRKDEGETDPTPSIDVRVGIVDDNINERDVQLFLIAMNYTDTIINSALVDITERNVTIGIIADNDDMVIGFSQSEFSFDEPSNIEPQAILLVKELNRPTEQTFNIQVNLQDITGNVRTALFGEDYVIPGYRTNGSNVFELKPNQDMIVLNWTLFPDNITEGVEGYILEISPSDDPKFTFPSPRASVSRQVIVTIRDVDPFIIGFEEPVYTVNESESVMICIIVYDPPVELTFSLVSQGLLFQSSPQLMSASDSDFDLTGNQLFYVLPSSGPNMINSRRICNEFRATADRIVEGTESLHFQLNLIRAPAPVERILLQPARTTVQIIDQTAAIVGFTGEPYIVQESDGTATVNLGVISGTLDINITLNIELQSGSATAPNDYLSSLSTSTITLNGASPTATVSFPIVDDSISEPTENVFVMLSFAGSSPAQVILNPSRAQISIVDNDLSGTRVNDTVIGDPLYTVPIRVPQEQLDALGLTKLSLCYEIHGQSGQWFNLVTDDCVSVNTRYAGLTRRLNIMDSVAVRAVDDVNQCVNIRVDVDQCSATVGNSSLAVLSKYESNGIMVKRYSNRVRITVPNCQDLTLVMWVICEDRTLENPDQPETFLTSRMIKFVVMRGLNFGSRQAHGLLGQFWNVPVTITPYNGLLYGETPAVGWYIVNITTNGINRAYGGNLHTSTWDNSEGPCLFVGNRQSGPTAEIKDPNDPVIQEIYTSYEVKQPFVEDDDYKLGMFDETKCN